MAGKGRRGSHHQLVESLIRQPVILLGGLAMVEDAMQWLGIAVESLRE